MAMSVSRLLDLLFLSMVSRGWGTYIDMDINLYDRDWSGTLHSCVLSPEISQLPSDETLLPEHGCYLPFLPAHGLLSPPCPSTWPSHGQADGRGGGLTAVLAHHDIYHPHET